MIVQRRRRRRDDAALRPSGGQWLYDTADDDGVCRAARHCSIAEAEQSKAKDGQNSGTQSVTEQVEAKQNEAGSLDCARACVACELACLDHYCLGLLERAGATYTERAPYSLLHCHYHRHSLDVLLTCFEFALIKPDVEADLDLRGDHTGADIFLSMAITVHVCPTCTLANLYKHYMFMRRFNCK